jgi:hypothetical protein
MPPFINSNTAIAADSRSVCSTPKHLVDCPRHFVTNQ